MMDDYTKCKTVSFSGKRILAYEKRLSLECDLFNLVKSLAQDGYKKFICGGALGFDTISAVAVIKRKREFDINLTIVMPHKGQHLAWSVND